MGRRAATQCRPTFLGGWRPNPYPLPVLGRGKCAIALLAWAVAVTVAIVLGAIRYKAAISTGQPDLAKFFLPAAQEIVAGRSPYNISGYYYTPFVALILTPMAHSNLVVQYWTGLRLCAAIAACVVSAVAIIPTNCRRAGILATITIITLLWSWPATLDLWMGQVQFLVLLSLAIVAWANVHSRRFATGFFLGVSALLKSWSGLFMLWLLRDGRRTRRRQWLGALCTLFLAVLSALLVGGPKAVRAMVLAPLDGDDQPRLASYSVWGISRMLWSTNPVGLPIKDAPTMRTLMALVLLAWVVILLVINIRRPGPAQISLFNLVFIVILLMPVSHYTYVIYPLPALWWWTGRMLSDRRDRSSWIAFLALLVWWIMVFRISPAGDGAAITTWQSILRVFASTLIAATVSIIAAARIDPEIVVIPVSRHERASENVPTTG